MKFDWDEANIAHIAEHNVTPREAVEVFFNNPLEVSQVTRGNELRSRLVGVTAAKRFLVVIWTPRNGEIRIVTAYDAPRKLRGLYLERRPQW